ncbi:MAG: glycosyltransferase family protein [Candidatus Nealsonbacteria bacterium]
MKKDSNQIFIQARMGSIRLPGKVLMKICGKTVIELIVERLQKVKDIDRIVLVTSNKKQDEPLVKESKKLKIDYFKGSEENVLDRFYQASLKFKPDNIIRVTGDCPLIDFNLINKGLKIFKKGNYDVLSNTRVRTFPDGFDFEIFKSGVLKTSWQENKFKEKFINPVKYLLEKKKFKNKDLINNKNLSNIRLILDYKEDFELIKKIYESFKNKYFTQKNILNILKKKPYLLNLNKKYICLDYGIKVEKK